MTAHGRGSEDQPTLPAPQRPSSRIGDYRLLQRLGEGGMGEVWEAEQERPVRRRVALKLVKWGMDTREVLARFESERQALALMDHPTIAKVFDAGATDQGRPYFAMEFVKGVPITQYADTQRLTTRQRIDLIAQVCHGIQHAHQKGIIHRDIKPSNILVTIQDGKPAPKIIDFGVAKAIAQRLTERTVFTQLGQWVGTPEYMSPEQAEMTGLDIDTRTDVYSLGVLQYELLTGALPFQSRELRQAGFDEMRRRIREDEPTKPSTMVSGQGDEGQVAAHNRGTDSSSLARELHGDLDWITMKALEKDRTRRYASPAALAEDIERHLRHEPVVASPPNPVYRMRKFVRRHRLGVAAGITVLAALVLGTTGATIGLLRARSEARTAREVSGFLVGMFSDLGAGGSQRAASTPQEILRRGIERIEAELAGQPRVQAQLLTAVGSTYRGLGMSESAREQLERALAIRRRLPGRPDREHAMTISILGDLLLQLGEYDQALVLHQEALEIRRRILGREDPTVAWSLRSLAFARWRQNDYEAARELYEQALAINVKARGAESFDAAATLRLRALLEQEVGEYETSRRLFGQALAIFEKTAGPNHSEVGWCLTDYSLLLQRIGDYDEALATSARAVKILEEVFGPDHPSVAAPLLLNSVVLLDLSDIEGARARLERARVILESAPEKEHALLGWVLNELGRVALSDGDLEEAGSLFERALVILERVFGTDHPHVAFPLSNLGRVLTRGGEYEAARPLFERALEVRERAFGPNHPELAWTLRPMAALLRLSGDIEGARRLLERTLAITRAAFGEEHLETARTLASIGYLEYTLGNLSESRRIYDRVLELRQAVIGRDHSGLGETYFSLACLAALAGDAEEALGFLRRAVDLGYASRLIFTDSDLDSLRGDPRFEALEAEVRSRLGEAS